ncbi:hypothetical protein [Succinatimonas hippei]|uniref:hypothetical protein n=1 Tax=Succinatimonas hippei TaxID=626938 RepID=UPI002492B219|nr:hypothetical protein [Succinatimonas hippei]
MEGKNYSLTGCKLKIAVTHTWYKVGLGMAVKSSENSYLFIEGEAALGDDNEDTYTVSGGFRHCF